MTPALLLAAFLLAAPAPATPPKDGTTLTVKKSGVRTIKIPGLARIAIGDPTIADIKPKGATEVVIKGLADGKTTVLVWTTDGARRSYLLVVGNAKGAPDSAAQPLDKVVSGGSAGVVEELTLALAIGEEKAYSYSDVSKVTVTQDSPVVQVSPIDGTEGVRVKGVAAGSAKVQLHVGGRPAVRIEVIVSKTAAEKAPPPGQPRFGGRAIDHPDCNGDSTTLETAKMVAESVDLDRAKKHAEAIAKLLKVIEKQPAAAHAYLKLGVLYAKTGDAAKGATAYETFALSCPNDAAAPKVRAILDEAAKAEGKGN